MGRRFHLGLKYTHPYYTTLFSVYKTKFLGLDHLQRMSLIPGEGGRRSEVSSPISWISGPGLMAGGITAEGKDQTRSSKTGSREGHCDLL